MATTKTQTDLVNQGLRVLGILAAGQAADPEDFDAMLDYVGPLVAELDVRRVVTVDDVEAIPEEWFFPLAVLLGDRAAREFGLQGVPPTSSDPNPVLTAETRLRQCVYGQPTGQSQRADYF
jgi:hypothetical protein